MVGLLELEGAVRRDNNITAARYVACAHDGLLFATWAHVSQLMHELKAKQEVSLASCQQIRICTDAWFWLHNHNIQNYRGLLDYDS